MISYPVWLPGVDETDPNFKNMDTLESLLIAYLDLVGPQIAELTCKSYFKQFSCGAVFLPCEEITSDVFVPRLNCEENCNELHKTCRTVVGAALAVQRLGAIIVPVPEISETGQCNVDIFGGDTPFSSPAENPAHFTEYPFPEGYTGHLVFPTDVATYVYNGQDYSVRCFGLSENFTTTCITKSDVVCRDSQIVNPYYDDFLLCLDQDCQDAAAVTRCLAEVCPSHMEYVTGLTHTRTQYFKGVL